MTLFTRATVFAFALATPWSLTQAQTAPGQDHTAHHPAGQTAPQKQQGRGGMPQGQSDGMPMMGSNMDQMMQMMQTMQMMREVMAPHGMGSMGGPGRTQPFAHVEGQLAFYKTELKITDAQAPQWNAFADVVREGAKKLQAAFEGATRSPAGASAIDQADRKIMLLSARLDELKAVTEATRSLYAVLSDDQKKTANELFAEHLRGM